MSDIPYVYKNKRGFRYDYFACDTDPNVGKHTCVIDWDRVTCPDCLAHAPLTHAPLLDQPKPPP